MSSDARIARPEPRPPICSSCGHYESDHTAEGCTAVGMVTSCGCTLPPDAPAPPPRTAIPTGCERGLSVMTCQQLDRCGHHHDANYEWCWVVTDERAYTADEVRARLGGEAMLHKYDALGRPILAAMRLPLPMGMDEFLALTGALEDAWPGCLMTADPAEPNLVVLVGPESWQTAPEPEPVPEPSPEQVMRESGAADLWGAT